MCVIGLGYIGLPTAAMFASNGIDVCGVDVNPGVVDAVNRGQAHFAEPELASLLKKVVSEGRLHASCEPEAADAFIIAVPTPFKDDHEPDLRFVDAATEAVAGVLKKGDLIVLESTSPVGTTDRLLATLRALRLDIFTSEDFQREIDVNIAYCPERVLPGQILQEIVSNDRIIGGVSEACAKRAAGLYGVFVTGECLLSDAKTAEMCKLAENAFRDVNIAFANELSLICDELGIDVWRLIALANRHPRVKVLRPGPGVGGHCVAVDPWFIVNRTPSLARLIRTAREVNSSKPHAVVEKVANIASKLKNPKIVCLGLAFKADVGDLRESPCVEIVTALVERNLGSVIVVEPFIQCLPEELDGMSVVLSSVEDALKGSDVVVILTDHTAFRSITQAQLAGTVVVDTRGPSTA